MDETEKLRLMGVLLEGDWINKLGRQLQAIADFMELSGKHKDCEYEKLKKILKKFNLKHSYSGSNDFQTFSVQGPGNVAFVEFKTSQLDYLGILQIFRDSIPHRLSNPELWHGSSQGPYPIDSFETKKLWVIIWRMPNSITRITWYQKSRYPTIEDVLKIFPNFKEQREES